MRPVYVQDNVSDNGCAGNSLRGEEERLNFNCANGMKQYLINYKTGVRSTGSGHGVDMEAMLV